MKKLLLLFVLLPMLSSAQIEKTIKLKLAVMQNFVSKGEEGQTMFWQTKGKITFGIVNYTEAQNYQFKELFINQYKELETIYNKMIVSQDERDTDLYIRTLIRQEDDYRKLLTAEQLAKYTKQLADFEKNNPQANDSYSSLFFSDNLLKEFKTKFQYK
ncbi:hypothetical protein [Flavobacterium sp.]|uniref:hypothetical protein n=1 Tax=Flavobacterium sp. TaxID=239 RepID=UPI002B4B5DBD|nr:hypothetical protein [Flavobacterium sp.]HLP64775.1 hypothetical protein [Flavobacterium sp.]